MHASAGEFRRCTLFHQKHVKHHLCAIQEQLDGEMSRSADGAEFTEGAYLNIMNSVKEIWKSVDFEFVL